MRFPWANLGILVLVLAQLATGSGGLVTGSENLRWILWLHGIGAYAAVFILIWKGAVILDSLIRRRNLSVSRVSFVILAILLIATLTTGILWTFAGRRLIYGYSLITIHVVVAIGVLILLPWHVYRMRFIFRVRNAVGRRAFLRLGGTVLAGLALWQGAAWVMNLFDLPGSKRRFTGSYETGSFSSDFPVVHWLFDYPAPIDVGVWRLRVEGAVEQPFSLTYLELEQMAGEKMDAIIDCTGGWYATQAWQGVSVSRLLERAGLMQTAHSVSFIAVSGYARRFSIEESQRYILALQVAGQRLNHDHGFPVRLVAPPHRGFEWVKWISSIRVNESSKWWQPPVPLQ